MQDGICSAPKVHTTMRNAGGAALGSGLQRVLALVGEVEGGRLSLAPLAMEHPLLGWTALRQQAYSHYARATLPELVKLLGSANVLGGCTPVTIRDPCPASLLLCASSDAAHPRSEQSLMRGWLRLCDPSAGTVGRCMTLPLDSCAGLHC